MNAFEELEKKPRTQRSAIEQCIVDASILEDMHDGDYELVEQAAETLKAVGELVRTVEDFLEGREKLKNANPPIILASQAIDEIEQALKKVQQGRLFEPFDVGN